MHSEPNISASLQSTSQSSAWDAGTREIERAKRYFGAVTGNDARAYPVCPTCHYDTALYAEVAISPPAGTLLRPQTATSLRSP